MAEDADIDAQMKVDILQSNTKVAGIERQIEMQLCLHKKILTTKNLL